MLPLALALFLAADIAPVLIADAPVLSLGNHRGPRIAFTAAAIVVTAGVGPLGQQYAPNTLRSWRSTNRGKTWTAGPDLSTGGAGGMGFQAIASDGRQRLFATWIGPANGHPTLFMSHSDDAGLTWAKQRGLRPNRLRVLPPHRRHRRRWHDPYPLSQLPRRQSRFLPRTER